MNGRLVLWLVGAALGAALVGLLATIAPIVAAAAVVVLAGVTFVLIEPPRRVVTLFLHLLGFCLTGYAFLGKGFAYLGVPPLFIGEITLAAGLLIVLVRGDFLGVFRAPLMLLLIAFGVWSASQTMPYIGTYGVLAVRDAALWGYGAYTLIVAVLLAQPKAIERALAAYGRYFWWFVFWAPIYGIVARRAGDSLPRMPGTDVPVLLFKPGDAAVHLAAIAAFTLLGLQGTKRVGALTERLSWVWWGAWLASLAVAASASRGGFLATVLAIGTVLTLRRQTRWWRPALATLVLGSAFFASNIEIDVGLPRTISSRQLVSNLASIGSDKADINLEGTREWRLAWWGDIVNYTVHGPYFWTGKGFGVNLADDDGYQGGGADYVPNRSPHNVQMTVLARAGVPGLVLWVLLQGTFVFSLIHGYFRALRLRWDWWARVNLWILAYWIALLVNGTFDVYIEGPQGGIWFWCIIGVGVAALERQRREAAVAASAAAAPAVRSARVRPAAASWVAN